MAEYGDVRIVCAANIYPDGTIILGARHFDPLMHATIAAYRAAGHDLKPGSEVQGFIDQQRNFLTREEAHKIAFANGQAIYRCGGDREKLFSENLY